MKSPLSCALALALTLAPATIPLATLLVPGTDSMVAAFVAGFLRGRSAIYSPKCAATASYGAKIWRFGEKNWLPDLQTDPKGWCFVGLVLISRQMLTKLLAS